ncbi:MAG: N-acetylmuramoyl-L-alanine amidase [Candidatus Eisenbacteria bacterium]
MTTRRGPGRVTAAGIALLAILAGGLVLAAADAGAARKKKRPVAAARRKPPPAPVTPVAQSIRSYSGPDATRLVLDLSAPATYRLQADPNAATFDVVIERAMVSPSLALPAMDDGAVKAVTVIDAPEGLRLRFHLPRWSPPRIFGLEGEVGVAPRIVIDIDRPGQAERDAAERARVAALTSTGQRVIVIDPGHGGEAVGAIGPKRTYEKTIALAIARELEKELEKNPGVSVVLTRTGDYDVPLRDRYRMAERYQADAFVSIHMNSAPGRNGSGSEVYFLSLKGASNVASKALADKENASDRISAGPGQRADDDLAGILFDLKQTEALQQSSLLAVSVLERIEAGRGLPSRGVKQAPFAVLKSPIVPAVLVECAFINNPNEERLLRDPEFQRDMARMIARGVVDYLGKAPPVVRGRTSSTR